MWKKINKHMISHLYRIIDHKQFYHIYLRIIFVIAFTPAYIYCTPCANNFWWDSIRDSCIPCTVCTDDNDGQQLIVLRSCQPHTDTICGSLNDLEFDYNNWYDQKFNQKNLVTDTVNDVKWTECTNDPLPHEPDTILWDWQSTSLTMVAGACLLLFIVVAYISFRNAKQWKKMEKMERKFDRDVEELSTRLMSTIVDIRAIENGRIILEELEKDKLFNPLEVRCVYLEQLIAGMDLVNETVERGNLYIEELKNKKTEKRDLIMVV